MEAQTSLRTAMLEIAGWRSLGRWLAVVAASMAFCVASVFAARRWLDSWQRGLGGGELLLLTGVAVGSALSFRLLWRWQGASSQRPELALHLLPTCVVLLLATAFSSTESPLWGVIVLWTALAIEETWFWMSVWPVVRRTLGWSRLVWPAAEREGRHRGSSEAAVVVSLEGPPLPVETEATESEDGCLEDFPPNRLQQLTRFRDEDGAEVIHGLLRAELAPNQRVHYLHVAFCPPLDAVPEFACEQVDGPEATLTPGQVETYGVRIDLRLAAAGRHDASVVVEFYARAAG